MQSLCPKVRTEAFFYSKKSGDFFEKDSAALCASVSAVGGHSTLATREVFLRDVHAAAKNSFALFCRSSGKTLRGNCTKF